MKKKIVLGSILSIILLMMLPSVSAVEFTTVVESNKAQLLEQIQSINIDELRETIKNLDMGELKEQLKTIDYSLIEYAESNKAQMVDQIKNIDATILFPLLGIISLLLFFSLFKSGAFGKLFDLSYHPNIFDRVFGFVLFFYAWISTNIYMLKTYHIIIPLWLYIILCWLALLG